MKKTQELCGTGPAIKVKKVGSSYRLKTIRKELPYLIMMIIPVLFFLLFKYWPMFGIAIAFQDYRLGDPFISAESNWVGLKWFKFVLSRPDIKRLVRNTLALSFLNMFVSFPISIAFALLLNEIRIKIVRKFTSNVIVHILLLLKTMETGADLDAMQYINRFFWGLLPCMLIIGPARAGLAQVMRNWAAEEYISAIPVFIDGFKENWKQALIISALAGVFPVAAWYGLLTSIHSGTSYMITILIVACVLYGFFLLAQQILFPSIVTYELPLKVHIKNAFILTVLRLPSALLICAASMGVVILYIVIVAIRPDWVYAALIVPVLYYFFVGFSVTELIRASYYRSLRAKYFEQETVPKFGD